MTAATLGHNFTLCPAHLPLVTAHNRAFAYGDALFETVIFRAGQPRFWDHHWARLRDGMRALQMRPPAGFTATRTAEFMGQVARANQLPDVARLRLRVVRQSGGLYTPTRREVDFFVEADVCQPPPAVRQRVAVGRHVWLCATPWSRFKTGSALPYVLAGLERTRRKLDELLLLDHQGFLAEATAANLFWQHQDALYTPALTSGCVGGVMRLQVVAAARAAGLTVHEGLFRAEVLARAERVFTSNVAGLVPLATLRRRAFEATLPAYLSSLA